MDTSESAQGAIKICLPLSCLCSSCLIYYWSLTFFLSLSPFLPPLSVFLAHMYTGRSDFKERKRKPAVGELLKRKLTALSLPGFSGGSVLKNLPANAGDARTRVRSLDLGRSPGEGNDNPPQHSCLEIPMDRGAWWATAHGLQRVGHSLMTEQQQHNRQVSTNTAFP